MATHTEPGKAPRCSWCHKSQDEVAVLISSPSGCPPGYPRAYICDECVAVCDSILKERGIETIDLCRARVANRISAVNSANSTNSTNTANTVREGAIQ